MTELNRRDVIRGAAAGAALAGAASAAAVSRAGPTADVAFADVRLRGGGRPLAAATLLAAAAAARGRDAGLALPDANPVCAAQVLHCRSLGGDAYLYVCETVRGFVELGAEGFAIAAACQAAGRPVAVRYWGYEPDAHGGVGRFAGAVVAIDPHDVPAAATAEA